jgi:hypothetical protein
MSATDAPDRNAVRLARPRPQVALVTIASQPLGVLRIAVKERMLAILGIGAGGLCTHV